MYYLNINYLNINLVPVMKNFADFVMIPMSSEAQKLSTS